MSSVNYMYVFVHIYCALIILLNVQVKDIISWANETLMANPAPSESTLLEHMAQPLTDRENICTSCSRQET